METYTIDKAKNELSSLVEKAIKGETVVIVQDGGKTVRVMPCSPVAPPAISRCGGIWANQIWYAPDYDEADGEIAQLMNESRLFPEDLSS